MKRAEADYILTNREPNSADIESILLGQEENVLVASPKYEINAIYLDHDAQDETTHHYFKQNKLLYKPQRMRFLDDVYGLIDGVKNGYGQAVLPKHLVDGDKELEIMEKKKSVLSPVYLHFFHQPYYRPDHAQVVEALRSYCKLKLR